MSCDGGFNEDDCYGLDDTSTVVAAKSDFDGVLTANDCNKSNVAICAIDLDRVRFVSYDNDCDDNEAILTNNHLTLLMTSRCQNMVGKQSEIIVMDILVVP